MFDKPFIIILFLLASLLVCLHSFLFITDINEYFEILITPFILTPLPCPPRVY